MRDIAVLHQIGEPAPQRWGNKAATLAKLATAFNVPPGVVLAAGGHDADPAELTTLADAVARLGPGPFAVRSSSVDKDTVEHAAAGRYTTLLGAGPRDVADAARRVLASADGAPMAVLVQSQVPATAAGVAFSAHPLTGDREQTVVDAVRGLGDRLVGGDVTPEEWVVSGGEAVRSGDDAVLTEAQARRVADLARAVEAACGRPQDIEWAFAGDILYLLQARPITTIVEPVPVPVDVPGGYWIRGDTHVPEPQTPLTLSVFDPNPGCQRMARNLGLPVTIVSRTIGGYYYASIQPVGVPVPKPGKTPPKLPGWAAGALLAGAMLASREGRTRMRAARRGDRDDVMHQIVREWTDELRPRFARRAEELAAVDVDALDDAGVALHLQATVDHTRLCLYHHYTTAVVQWITSARLILFCERTLGWDATKTLGLLAGTSSATSQAARELAGIADLPAGDRDAAMAAFERRHGRRLVGMELADPTYAEIPGLLAAQLTSQLPDPDRDDAAARARADLAGDARAGLAPGDRERFEDLLVHAVEAYPVRDENVLYTYEMPMAEVRYAALSAGRRMAGAEALRSVTDVFYLEVSELLAWLEGSRDADLGALVRRRRGERAWCLAHPGPAFYGQDPGGPPSLALLPRPVRELTAAFVYATLNLVVPKVRQSVALSGDVVLAGTGASPGTYTGTVRVVRSEAEFGKVRTGDVLVCQCTRPSWAVVLGSVGAIVTDVGGVLSHPAIIAQEMRIPAVVATGSATAVLRDGETVAVDGGAGTVRRV
ncbi:PEP/pyruvate-binding domain-containing protein [Georgenia sp. AZ-5]|uniref:PEP/pyruvate-binding domain-containing protein n=1 Tax=Georgenia sp. AZ-5 TaxID=3367526 RepID=UPI0037542450